MKLKEIKKTLEKYANYVINSITMSHSFWF